MRIAALSLKPLALSLTLCCLIISCGKKTAPTLKEYEKPDAPANLHAIHREDMIILSWSYGKNENLRGFNILKSEDADFKKIAFVSKDENSYIDTDFKTDRHYKFKIAAQSMKNVLSNDSNLVEVKLRQVPPAPKNILFKAGNNSLLISWEPAGENIYYNIYKSHEKGKYGLNSINDQSVKTASYDDSLDLDKTVYYTIRGFLTETFRDEGPASDEIEVNPETFTPSRPEKLIALATDDKLVLMWKENAEEWVAKYRIYCKADEKDGFEPIGESVTPVFIIREKTGRKHICRVAAIGPAKESEPSETVETDF